MPSQQAQIQTLQEQLNELVLERNTLASEMSREREALEEMRVQVRDAQTSVAALQGKRIYHEECCKEAMAKTEAAQLELSCLKKAMDAVNFDLIQLANEYVEKRNEYRDFREDLAELTVVIAQTEQERDRLAKAHKRQQELYEAEVLTWKEKITGLQKNAKEITDGLSKEKRDMATKRNQLQAHILQVDGERELLGELRALVFQYAEELGITLPIKKIYNGKK